MSCVKVSADLPSFSSENQHPTKTMHCSAPKTFFMFFVQVHCHSDIDCSLGTVRTKIRGLSSQTTARSRRSLIELVSVSAETCRLLRGQKHFGSRSRDISKLGTLSDVSHDE